MKQGGTGGPECSPVRREVLHLHPSARLSGRAGERAEGERWALVPPLAHAQAWAGVNARPPARPPTTRGALNWQEKGAGEGNFMPGQNTGTLSHDVFLCVYM